MSKPELFECAPFLETKLGIEVFEAVPQNPGIYRFYDETETLLYVGKAKNLRRRLFTYKRARPGRTSRKEAALISRICRFEYDVFESEQEAILEENRWIREHRPGFNHANKHTETYYFVTVQKLKSGFIFGLSMNSSGKLFPATEKPLYRMLKISDINMVGEAKVYGCFKGHRIVRSSFGALLQLLWIAEHQTMSPHFLPVQLSRNLAPLRFRISFQDGSLHDIDGLEALLDDWFLGISADVILFLSESIARLKPSGFSRKFTDDCLAILLSYFQKNLVRHRIIRETYPGKSGRIIEQDQFDDLIAVHLNAD